MYALVYIIIVCFVYDHIMVMLWQLANGYHFTLKETSLEHYLKDVILPNIIVSWMFGLEY